MIVLILLLWGWLARADEDRRVTVTQVEFKTGIDDILWIGHDNATVLLRTSDGHVFKSLDHGRSFSDISSRISDDEVRFVNITKHQTDSNTAVATNFSSEYFITHDTAKSWTKLQLLDGSKIGSVNMNPAKTSHLLASSWTRNCEVSNGPDCHKSLWLSTDNGNKFSKILSFVHSYRWSEDGKQVLYTFQKDKSKRQIKANSWHPGYDFAEYDVYSKSNTVHLAGGNKFLIQKEYTFVAVANDDSDTVELYVSKNREPFKLAKFPFDGGIKATAYTVLDASNGAVTMQVQHDSPVDSDGQKTGNIYISDGEGINYTLSLGSNIRAATGQCEFESIRGLAGVYIANRIDSQEVIMPNSNALGSIDDEQSQQEKMRKMLRRPVNTVVSFNHGATWHKLKPPDVDSQGNPIDCKLETGCSLHLHGITRYHTFAPYYSVERAVGIVMGTGNVGTELQYDAKNVNTYISRDGGANWHESHKGNYIYEFGDSGSLLVMANDSQRTNEVIFSWNEGETWYDFELGNRDIIVENVVIEPTSSHTEFLVYGLDGSAGVLYHLDFKTLGLPSCKNPGNPDSVSSDYITWILSPSAYTPGVSKCINGVIQKYTRKKRSVQCFNGRDFQPTNMHEMCSCTQEDYMCSMGFYRAVDSSDCLPDPSGYSSPDCRQSKIMYVYPYVKIPGNRCVGGWTPSSTPVLCTVRSPIHKSSQFTLLGMAALVFLFGCVAFVGSNVELRERYITPMTDYVLVQTHNTKNIINNMTNTQASQVGDVQLQRSQLSRDRSRQ